MRTKSEEVLTAPSVSGQKRLDEHVKRIHERMGAGDGLDAKVAERGAGRRRPNISAPSAWHQLRCEAEYAVLDAVARRKADVLATPCGLRRTLNERHAQADLTVNRLRRSTEGREPGGFRSHRARRRIIPAVRSGGHSSRTTSPTGWPAALRQSGYTHPLIWLEHGVRLNSSISLPPLFHQHGEGAGLPP